MRRHVNKVYAQVCMYSQPSPCGHHAITDTPIIRTAAEFPAKMNYRRLTEIFSRYYGLSLLRTLTRSPEGVRNNGSSLYVAVIFFFVIWILCP